MKRVLIESPACEPETIAMLRKHCRIDSHEEDDMLVGLLKNAREAAEEFLWKRLVTQTWDQYFDEFSDSMRLDISPVQSIASVKYLDTSGVLQTLSSTTYELGDENGIAVVRLAYDQSWPSTRGVSDAVVIRHVVGYGDSHEDIPMMVRAAIRIHVEHFYKRDGNELPQQFYDCLRPITARRCL
jgi:uncharacterized phiE125 gp8 family phage protein